MNPLGQLKKCAADKSSLGYFWESLLPKPKFEENFSKWRLTKTKLYSLSLNSCWRWQLAEFYPCPDFHCSSSAGCTSAGKSNLMLTAASSVSCLDLTWQPTSPFGTITTTPGLRSKTATFLNFSPWDRVAKSQKTYTDQIWRTKFTQEKLINRDKFNS